uniref:Lipocalin/cytosolic fatty-acid binding domain-containing protein n=1 Tax=Suricata suricatta TaxID=37032 RepID=A0A673VNM1_SURSU
MAAPGAGTARTLPVGTGLDMARCGGDPPTSLQLSAGPSHRVVPRVLLLPRAAPTPAPGRVRASGIPGLQPLSPPALPGAPVARDCVPGKGEPRAPRPSFRGERKELGSSRGRVLLLLFGRRRAPEGPPGMEGSGEGGPGVQPAPADPALLRAGCEDGCRLPARRVTRLRERTRAQLPPPRQTAGGQRHVRVSDQSHWRWEEPRRGGSRHPPRNLGPDVRVEGAPSLPLGREEWAGGPERRPRGSPQAGRTRPASTAAGASWPKAGLGPRKGGCFQFQGEWFVVGLAGSTHRKTDRSLLNPFTATFEQDGNRRLKVSYAMTRGHRCVTWSYVLVPAAQPGGFTVDSTEAPGRDPEEVQVYDTDYSTFALMLSRRQSGSQSIRRVSLLCAGAICQPGERSGPLGEQHRLPRPDKQQALGPRQEPGPSVGTCPRASGALGEPGRCVGTVLGVYLWSPGSPRRFSLSTQ